MFGLAVFSLITESVGIFPLVFCKDFFGTTCHQVAPLGEGETPEWTRNLEKPLGNCTGGQFCENVELNVETEMKSTTTFKSYLPNGDGDSLIIQVSTSILGTWNVCWWNHQIHPYLIKLVAPFSTLALLWNTKVYRYIYIYSLLLHLNQSFTTLPETNSSPPKISHPKRKRSYSKHPFSGASC